METFTLVLWLWLAPDEPSGWGSREARTPGLGGGCTSRAAAMHSSRPGASSRDGPSLSGRQCTKIAGALRRMRRDTGQEAGMMEPFTLSIWLMMGWRFEETRVPGLNRGECIERLLKISGARGSRDDRGRSNDKARCIGANGTILPSEVRQFPPCAHVACGWDLPGWRRV
jgi:hypothetical protein